jgi:hypothetical protein
VRELLAEGQIPETAIPSALDLLGLFVTAAALDRVPAASSTPQQHHDLLHWETEVILNGLATTAPQTQMPRIQSQGHSPARTHQQLLPGHSSTGQSGEAGQDGVMNALVDDRGAEADYLAALA